MACRLVQLGVCQRTLYPQTELMKIFLNGCISYSPYFAYNTKVEQIFTNTQIARRGMFVDPTKIMRSASHSIYEIEFETEKARQDMIALAAQNLKETLDKAQLSPKEIKHVITVSEFPSCPPVDTELCDKVGFVPSILRTPLIGFGCAATPIGLSAAMRYLDANPDEAVVVNALECSSRTWATQFPILLRRQLECERLALMGEDISHDDESKTTPLAKQIVGNIVIAALMGDGVASAILVGRNHRLASRVDSECVARGPWLHASYRCLFPAGQGLVGTAIHSCGTRMFLSTEIPRFVAKHAPSFIESVMPANKIKHWFCHPGGPAVLKGFQTELSVVSELLEHSYESLNQCGNCMSVSLFDVLSRYKRVPKQHDTGIIFGVGPGMTMEVNQLLWK